MHSQKTEGQDLKLTSSASIFASSSPIVRLMESSLSIVLFASTAGLS